MHRKGDSGVLKRLPLESSMGHWFGMYVRKLLGAGERATAKEEREQY